MKYYLIDYGIRMERDYKLISENLTKNGDHFIAYQTDADGLMCIEEISEDEFLNHFKKNKNTN